MSTLRVDNIKSRTGTTVTIPSSHTLAVTGNTTVTGSLTVSGGGSFSTSGTITSTGGFTGDLTGNVTGNVTGSASTLASGATGTDLTLSGNLTVNGTTTTVNSTTLTVDDKNIELGSVATPTNDTANGGGITIKGATDKEFKWVKATTGPHYWSLGGGFLYASEGLSTVKMLKEQADINSTSLAGDSNIYLDEGMVHYRSGNLTGTTSTPNVKYNASTNLNDAMNTGESLTFTIIQATNSTSAYVPGLQIDGASITSSINWVGGSAPSDGGGSGVDIYTFTIIKTGNQGYVVIGNQTKTS